MKTLRLRFTAISLLILSVSFNAMAAKDKFPDGTPVGEWFHQYGITPLEQLGRQYVVTDFGVKNDSTIVQTEALQRVIDLAAQNGGGVVVIPKGTFLSGSLFFKPKTHLHLADGGTLKGSDDISDFKIIDTRLEGQMLKYFAALVNAIKADSFTISGKGRINGNGLRYWRSFWLRRQYNPKCTNLEEMRPRLLYIAESKDVCLSGVRLENSPFWTTHLYRCDRVKLLNLDIYAPQKPVKAPSSDAVDIDVCKNILVKGCRIAVNDDAIAFKGGKGPDAESQACNGANEFIIIEDSHFGHCPGAMTFGSESLHTRNVIFRNCTVDGPSRLLWLKMRPDTRQKYEFITISNVKGYVKSMLCIRPWTQFFDMKGRSGYLMSYAENVTMRNLDIQCSTVFDVGRAPSQFELKSFTFENLKVEADKIGFVRDEIQDCTLKNVIINGDRF